MEQDTYETPMVFRKFRDGEIIALMPYSIADTSGHVDSYVHVGQHSAADYNHVINKTKLATEAEYANLLNELTSIGYKVKPIKKRNYSTYLDEYYKLRNKR